MTKEEAVQAIADGHSFYSPDYAKEICQTLGLELPDSLIDHYAGQEEANPTNDPKGLWLNEDKPMDGVASYRLSRWITNKLIGSVPSDAFHGRGSGARANAEAIAKHFGTKI